jgi:hypothetical protein
MSSKLIPFGKYKNQPIEVLSKDEQYLQWLLSQDWFKNRYKNIYNVIINNFSEPVETPEHNKMVSLFLSDELCMSLVKKTIDIEKIFNQYENEQINFLQRNKTKKAFLEKIKNGSYERNILINRIFEDKSGNDLVIWYDFQMLFDKRQYKKTIYSLPLLIECKPIISEDYPAVIRQCKHQNTTVLVIDNYNVGSVSIKQMRQMFAEFTIILLDEIKK